MTHCGDVLEWCAGGEAELLTGTTEKKVVSGAAAVVETAVVALLTAGEARVRVVAMLEVMIAGRWHENSVLF